MPQEVAAIHQADGAARQRTGSRPLIGISGRRAPASVLDVPSGFADAPLDVYLSEYASSIARAGGIPVHLSPDADVTDLIAHLDGVIISGGADVDPRRYGQVPAEHAGPYETDRDAFEFSLVAAALDANVPLLGICRGNQLLNVFHGGTLIQHLAIGEGESHGSYAYPRAHRVHDVTFEAGSIAQRLYGEITRVNSFHHQAVDVPGEGVRVTGLSPDGIVESIEFDGGMGVQWHPECFGSDPVFEWLVDESSGRKEAAA